MLSALCPFGHLARTGTRKRLLTRAALVFLSFLLTAQWAFGQACSVSVTTNPPSPVFVGQNLELNATQSPSSNTFGAVSLDGNVVCSSLPCATPLTNIPEGIHTLAWNCTTNGGNNSGTQLLVVGQAAQDFFPGFFIVSLVYAAPGNASQNGFTDSTLTGTTTAMTKTFQEGETTTFDAGFSITDIFKFDASASLGFQQTTTDTTTFTETITKGSGVIVQSTQDPLNHYQDRFFLWLNPRVRVTQTADNPPQGVFDVALPVDSGGNILPPAMVDVTVAELLNPAQIPLEKLQPDPTTSFPGLSSLCAQRQACTLTNACGCVPGDFANIVAEDPLVFDPNNPNTDPAAQPTQVDANRYFFQQSNKLEGPDCPPPTCSPTKFQFLVTDSTQKSATDTELHSVSTSVTTNAAFGPFDAPVNFTFRLTQTGTFTWTDGTTTGNINGNVTQASVIFGSATPQCSDEYNIYEDARYHTFAFAPTNPTPGCLTPQPDFNLVAFPPAGVLPNPTIINGGSTQYLVSSVDMLGFSGTEALSVTGTPLPPGLTASFSPASFALSPTNTTGVSILTITATNNTTPAGTFQLNVVGTGGGQSHTAPIAITVQDFQLAVTPNSTNVTANGSMTYTVTVTPLSGFNSNVVLSNGPLPAGVTAAFNPTSITGSGTSTLTITTSGASPGNSTFTVTGSAGTDTQTVNGISLSVVDFGVSAAPASQTLAQGGTKTYTVSTTALNGFSDAIALTLNPQPPSGISGVFNPSTISGAGTSTLTITAAATAPVGPTALNVNASSRGSVHTAGATVVINPPPAITALSAAQAPVGAFLTISGSNFNPAQHSNTITIGGIPATATSWSDTSVVAVVPPTPSVGSAPVVITVDGSPSNSFSFSVTAGITGLTPISGPVGSALTINGTDFGSSQGGSTVTVGGAAAAVTGWSDTSIGVLVPLSLPLGNAPVVVTVGSLASNSVTFFVTAGISSLSPPAGPVGTSVTISGTNFGSAQGTSTVTFGGTPVTPTNWTNSSITVLAPGLSVGSVNVVVTVGGAASNAATYTFTPGINNLSPSSGPVGTSVTINGSDFGASQGSSTVTVGGNAVTAVWGNSSIGISVPQNLGLGSTPVVVTVNGQTATQNFTVTPGITGFSIGSGPVGTSITITGTNFGTTPGTVTFGGVAATPTNWSPTSIVTSVPSGLAAGNIGVVVTASGFSSPSVNFVVTPAITSLTPASGPVGSTLTISGTSFGATQKASTVSIGSVTVSPSGWSDSSVTVRVPASLGLGAVAVVVTVAGLPSNSSTFNVTPGITSLSPSSGPVGSPVTITGTNFGASQGSTSSVTIAGVSVTPTSWSNTSIGFTVPASLGLGAVPVVVNVGGVASNSQIFSVTPGITSLSTASGPVGTSVTINGTNFGSTPGTVTFGGTTVSPSSWSNGSIVVAAPNLPPGSVSIAVTVSGLTSNSATFTVTPVITSLSLISGPVGTALTITGTNFGSSPGTVTFAGIAATPTSWSSTSIGVAAPAGLGSGSSPVVVTVNGAPSNTSFFTATPSIATLSPASGTTGSTVTINGSALGAAQGSSTITFNGVAASVTSWSNTTVLATVPASATTGNVVITVNNFPSNGVSFTVYSPVPYYPTPAASSTAGLLQLQTTMPASPTNIVSQDLINQPPGEYLIQAFDTQAGVPNSSSVWQAGLSATFTVYMTQTAGATGTLFPDVKLFLNGASGTPICGVVSSTALTTTRSLYTLSCAPTSNIALQTTDRFYLWVGVRSSATSAASETAQLTIGSPSRGVRAGNVSVPVR